MRRVIIESPYAGDVEGNAAYARRAMYDCLKRNEAPLASHLLYTQVLDDGSAEERKLGIAAGLAWYAYGVDACVVYLDRGVSKGMIQGMTVALEVGVPIEFREIGEVQP